MRKALGLAAALLFATGCVAPPGPSEANFQTAVAASMPGESGEILLSGHGTWIPNTRGMADLRNKLAMRGGGVRDPILGAIAITNRSIVFSQWDEKSKTFVPMKRIDLANVKSASLDYLLRDVRLVIESKDLAFDSFSYLKPGSSSFIDIGKTEEAARVIQSKIKPTT